MRNKSSMTADVKDLNEFSTTGIYEPPKAQGPIVDSYYLRAYPPYLSVKEAAAALEISPLILSGKCKRGEVPGVTRLGHSYIIPADYVDGILAARAGTVTQAQAADRLGVTRQYICQLVHAGKLRTRGGRVELDSLSAFAEGRAAKCRA